MVTAIVAATPLNDQTRGQFVYEFLDKDMVSSEMKSMLDAVVAYVGVGAIIRGNHKEQEQGRMISPGRREAGKGGEKANDREAGGKATSARDKG